MFSVLPFRELQDQRQSLLLEEEDLSPLLKNGANGYVRYHHIENPWFYRTIHLTNLNGEKVYFNRGSLINFLNERLKQQGNQKDFLCKGNFLGRFFSCFQGSTDSKVTEVYQQIILCKAKIRPVVRKKIFNFFHIPFTRFNRSFPPCAVRDTRKPRRISLNEKLELIRALQALGSVETQSRDWLCNEPEDVLIHQLIATHFPELSNLSTSGEHGYTLSFKDDDILTVHETKKEESIGDKFPIKFTFSENNKPILLQGATRGCAAACTAILIFENKKDLNETERVAVSLANLSTSDQTQAALRRAKLTPIEKSYSFLDELKEDIQKYGSAITSVDSCGAHVVIVDEITESYVRIRDPYHGWEVDVRRDAFQEAFSGSAILLVNRPLSKLRVRDYRDSFAL